MAAAGTFVSTFPATVTSCNAVTWSDDNRIAVANDDGLFVLELIVSPNHSDSACHFVHTNIPPSKDDPVSFIPYDFSKFSKSLKTDEVHQLMLDRTLCPNTECQTSIKGFKTVAWSPCGGDVIERCVLATITHDHQLCIFSSCKTKKTWTKVADLSSIYAQDNKCHGDLTFSILRVHSYKLAAMECSWSGVFTCDREQDKYCLLTVGMKNGDVVIWRIRMPCLQQSDCSFVKVVSLQSEIVTSLSWCPYTEQNNRALLAIGYHSGQIHLVDLDLHNEFKVRPTCIFSDEDNLRVSCMCWRKLKWGGCLLLSSKEQFVIAHKVCIQHKVTATRKTVGTGAHWMAATGLCNRDKLTVLSSADGSIQTLSVTELKNKNEEIVLDFSRVQFPRDEKYTWTCHGMSLSPNGCFCAAVFSPSSSFCHLELREPVKIQVIHVGDTEYIHEYAGPLSMGGDVLEAYRQGIACEVDLLDLIKEHRLNVTDLAEQPLKALKIYRFLFLTVDSLYHAPQDDSGEDFQPISNDIQKFTIEIHKRLIQQRFEAVNKLKRKLTDREKQSLKQSCIFLESSSESPSPFLKSDVCSKVKGRMKDTTPSVCPICQQSLQVSHTEYKCDSGHQFGVCCQSLLLCDQAPYRICQTCGALATPTQHIQDIPWLKADLNHCPLCEGQLI